jgi:hypothetical protein
LTPPPAHRDSSEQRDGRKLSILEHTAYGAAGLSLATVFLLAAWLHPDPAGLGTHTQLHLPPCGFYEVFHKPCPSCGMTTAFVWMMHGHPVRALRAQPAGAAVFMAGAFLAFYLPWAWAKRSPPLAILDAPAFLPVVLALIMIILVVWAVRVVY